MELSFGSQQFRLLLIPKYNLILVDVEGSNPVAEYERLRHHVDICIKECMKSLVFHTFLLFHGNQYLDKNSVHSVQLIRLDEIQKSAENSTELSWRNIDRLISLSPNDIRIHYGMWLNGYGVHNQYDIILSYRWVDHDMDMTAKIVDFMSSYSIGSGATLRSIAVFLDKKRLPNGCALHSILANTIFHSSVFVCL